MTTPVWMLFREDDNGQVFCMADHLTQSEAELLLDKHTQRAHKQTYYIRSYTTRQERQNLVISMMPDSNINGLGDP